MNNKKIILLAAVFGLLAALAVNFYLVQVKEASSNVEMGRVVTAKANIPAKTVLTQEMVVTIDVPKKYIHRDAYTDVNAVINRITKTEIVAGEQVLKSKIILKDQETKEGLSYVVPEGKRAVAIPVNEVTSIDGLIKPGDRVDVLGTISLDRGEEKKTVTHILLQDIEVLAVGKRLDSAVSKDDKKTPDEIKTITLAIPADKVAPVTLMSQKGLISLALRSPVDKGTASQGPYELLQFWP